MGLSPMHQTIFSIALTGVLAASSTPLYGEQLIPDDIGYSPQAAVTTREPVKPVVDFPIAEIAAPTGAGTTLNGGSHPAPSSKKSSQRRDFSNGCPGANNLQKSLAITSFLRSIPHTANAGNLFAVEQGLPELIKQRLDSQHQLIIPAVLTQGFASPSLNETQLKRQAQTIAKQQRTQFVLSGAVVDMGMQSPDATYNPGLLRQTANAIHDITRQRIFDARVRTFSIDMALRDGFTGEVLFNKHYSTSGVWNTRKTTGFNSAAFWKTPYGRQIATLMNEATTDIAQVINCQPFMAQIDARPGQNQILLHGGANNGLHAGDNLHLYQLIVQGSNNEYQVSDTRLVKRATQLYLSEVYPSHSVATIAGGSYLNGQFLAVSE